MSYITGTLADLRAADQGLHPNTPSVSSLAAAVNGGLTGPADALALDLTNLPAGALSDDVTNDTVVVYDDSESREEIVPISTLMDSFMDFNSQTTNYNVSTPAPSSNPLLTCSGSFFKVIFGADVGVAWATFSDSTSVASAQWSDNNETTVTIGNWPVKYGASVAVASRGVYTRDLNTGATFQADPLYAFEFTVTGTTATLTALTISFDAALNDGFMIFAWNVGPYKTASRTIAATTLA